jgi:Cdc6-like AAA superfamily ATPase
MSAVEEIYKLRRDVPRARRFIDACRATSKALDQLTTDLAEGKIDQAAHDEAMAALNERSDRLLAEHEELKPSIQLAMLIDQQRSA